MDGWSKMSAIGDYVLHHRHHLASRYPYRGVMPLGWMVLCMDGYVIEGGVYKVGALGLNVGIEVDLADIFWGNSCKFSG